MNSRPHARILASRMSPLRRALIVLLLLGVVPLRAPGRTPENAPMALELSRPARPWEFFCAVGRRAGLFGNESGRMEAWVYPLKLVREFRLKFHTDGRALPAETLARTVVVRPESSTILYAGDTFSVRETFVVPVNEPGAIILLDIETEQPLEIEATFLRDFQLEWPGALGGTYSFWDKDQRAFYLGEETRKFSGFVGSPTGTEDRAEYQTNYSGSSVNSFRLGSTPKGKESKLIVIAGSLDGRQHAEETYRRLSTSYEALLRDSAAYYQKYLTETVSVEIPDERLQEAYDWSRVSVLQGMVSNPFLGTGLVAGYRTSGESQRPGFAWFFGRDSLWTSLALDAAGDFANTRAALEFVSKYQRDDGKIPHEIAQAASFVSWFKDFPYGYASADATPLYIIAANDYVTESGDASFASEKWDSLWKAYQFLHATYDEQQFPKNFGIGHGWVEGGPLLPVKSELYQSGLGAEALRALAHLAQVAGKADVAASLSKDFEEQQRRVNQAFWLSDKKRYAFALGQDGKPIDEPSVLATVPMWFALLDQKNASAMITQLADSDHQTDWGMRIISDRSPKFSGGGYHYGSVWPLFTGWAAVGEYRYHHPHPAYANLRANALLALDGSLGHVTEVLSGDYYQPLSTSSPHQIWSAAMVISPLLRGMFGLSTDAKSGAVTFIPHVPASWSSFAIHNIRAGSAIVDFVFSRNSDAITLHVVCAAMSACPIDFQPSVSLRAEVLGADLNGKAVPFHLTANEEDQHISTRFSASGKSNTLKIRLRNDFTVSYDAVLPPLGSRTIGLRILSESWSSKHDALTLEVSGAAARSYQLSLSDPGQVASVDGAELSKDRATVSVRFPSTSVGEHAIVLHFPSVKSTAPIRKQ
jgi:glycogen debranching enzyme